MDQQKIGKFIAERRKQNNLTQLQLAEKLGITDRAISKWETGKTMPDSSLMLELCELLGITVNDLLNGEQLSRENYNRKTEEKLLEVVAEKQRSDQFMMSTVFFSSLALILLGGFICVMATAEYSLPWWIPSLFCCIAGILICAYSFLVVKAQQFSGYYHCQSCATTYTPTYKNMLWATGWGKTYTMYCPKCKKRTAHRHVYTKENG